MAYYQQEEPEYYEEDEYAYDDAGDEYYYEDEEDIGALAIGAKEGEGEHLTSNMFKKVQTTRFTVMIQGSPEDLESGAALKTYKLGPEIMKHFKQNMAKINRDIASGDELKGDLKRVIPLHLEVEDVTNSYPFQMGLRVNGIVPTTLTKFGRYVVSVPADTPFTVMERAVFEPKHIVDQYMYKDSQMASINDIRAAVDHKDGYSTIAVPSLPFEVLCLNIERGNFPNISEEAAMDILEPGRRRLVEVPTEIAKTIEESLKKPCENIERRFMNLENLVCEAVRADGQESFASFQNLHNEIVGSDVDPDRTLPSYRLSKNCQFVVTMRLKYKLLEN